MIQFALRFDDPSAISQHELEGDIIQTLHKLDVPATFAVVPFRETTTGRITLDASNGLHLLEAQRQGVIDIALHGHSHLKRNTTEQSSEFCGLPATHQLALLSEAVATLRTTFGSGSIRGFVPPWNSYDFATLDSLVRLEIDYISGCWKYPPSRVDSLVALPRTCEFTRLTSAIDEARRYVRFAPLVVAVLHHFDFFESGAKGAKLDLAEFAKRLQYLQKQSDVKIVSLHSMATTNDPAQLVTRVLARQRRERLPWRVKHRWPKHCLVHGSMWRVMLA